LFYVKAKNTKSADLDIKNLERWAETLLTLALVSVRMRRAVLVRLLEPAGGNGSRHMFVRLVRTLLLVVGLGLGLEAMGLSRAPIAFAAGIVVNSLADTTGPCATSGTGTCTLRDAMLYAENVQGNDTVTFVVSGTITLGSALPPLQDTLTIDGTIGGYQVTVDGANATNILVVKETGELALAGVTLTNALCDTANYQGYGAIVSSGTLRVENVTFTNNGYSSNNCDAGAAIRNSGGSATITGSTFTNNSALPSDGGAVANTSNGTLSIQSSTFTSNYGRSGGGVSSDSGTLNVTGSTFSENTTVSYNNGAGIYVGGGTANVSDSTFSQNFGSYGGALYLASGTLNVLASTISNNQGTLGGGGIYNDSGTLTVTNSTITGNNAHSANGGGIYNLNGTVYVVNSTITNNTSAYTVFDAGGIYNDGTAVTLKNSIIANNSEYECLDHSGTLTADAHNLVTDDSCGNAKQVNYKKLALGPLQKNGGPTETIALGLGSVALGAGDDAVCAAAVGAPSYGAGGLDQRGVSRTQEANCDAGAFESAQQQGPNYVVNDAADGDDGECTLVVPGLSSCTLREALNAANARQGGDNITFDIPAGSTGCTAANECAITLTSLLPPLTTNLMIDGSANNGEITIDGANVTRVFLVNANKTVSLNALNVVDGKCFCQDGGGVVNLGTLVVTNSTFYVTSTTGGDGTSIVNNGTATVANSTFWGNNAAGNFGAMLNNAGATLNVTNSTIAGHSYGIYPFAGTTTLRNTIISDNNLGDCVSGNGTLAANKYNLDSDGSCAKATTKTVQEIALGPLANNKGPTLTLKPGTTSAALNAANTQICIAAVGAPSYGAGGVDQRGVKRPKNGACDVGAVEVRVKN
jgi:CSLREA domain-containing protein